MTTRNKIVIEKKQAAKLMLFTMLTALPTAAAFSTVMGGDTVLWASLERVLGKFQPGQAMAQVNYNCATGWTNDPNCQLSVQDCDCPPPPPVNNNTWRNGGDGDSGGDSGA